jgi:F0F1-type ATP synthase membrane subunit b/b'
MITSDGSIIPALVIFLVLIAALNQLLIKPLGSIRPEITDAGRGRLFTRFVTRLGGRP